MPGKARAKKPAGKRNQSFLQSALILTAGVAVVKLIGALFKIPLFDILGAEGIGYFTAAYELYAPLQTLAMAGFPIAISRMVSENIARRRFRDVKQIHRVSVPIFGVLGLICFGGMIGGAFLYARFITSPGVIYTTLALSPTILFVCLLSIYRGYYQGMRNMAPVAVSEIVEAVCKLIIGLTLSSIIMRMGTEEYAANGTIFGTPYATQDQAMSALLPLAAAGAILGITIGAIVGFFFLMLRYKRQGDGITEEELLTSPKPRGGRDTVRLLIRIAVPVALGALITNMAGLIDTSLIQRRISDIMQTQGDVLCSLYPQLLNTENAGRAHTILYGCFASANTIVMLIPAITQVFGISALPTVTAAWTEGVRDKIRRSIESVIRITTMITFPAGLGLSVMAKPIAELLYLQPGNEAEVAVIAEVLSLLGIASIFLATSTPICSMLQAAGRVDLPVKLLSVGVVIKVALNYVVVGIPEINIQGAGLGTLVCYIFIVVGALVCLKRQTKVKLSVVSLFLKPALAAGICALSAYLSHRLLAMALGSSRLITLASLAVAVFFYVAALLSLRILEKEDVLMLPKGQKIAKILEKHRWIG